MASAPRTHLEGGEPSSVLRLQTGAGCRLTLAATYSRPRTDDGDGQRLDTQEKEVWSAAWTLPRARLLLLSQARLSPLPPHFPCCLPLTQAAGH